MSESPKIYTLYGGLGAGKSTLARSLSEHLGGIPHLSSDAIREQLTGGPNGTSKDVFNVMRSRLAGHLSAGSSVILDSTGQSPQFKQLVHDYASKVPMHKIQLNCDGGAWKQREGIRTDRYNVNNGVKTPFIMPQDAYDRSNAINLNPDLRVDTTHMKPEQVFNQVIDHLNKNPK